MFGIFAWNAITCQDTSSRASTADADGVFLLIYGVLLLIRYFWGFANFRSTLEVQVLPFKSIDRGNQMWFGWCRFLLQGERWTTAKPIVGGILGLSPKVQKKVLVSWLQEECVFSFTVNGPCLFLIFFGILFGGFCRFCFVFLVFSKNC